MVYPRSSRLARWQIWLLILSGILLWLSGALWLLLHYYGQIEEDFGPEPNPWAPLMLEIHGGAAIFSIFGFGGLFVFHISNGWKDVKRRYSGLSLSVVALVLILTGYLLYYAGNEILREWVSLIHWIIGLGGPAIFIWHFVSRYKRGKWSQPSPR